MIMKGTSGIEESDL